MMEDEFVRLDALLLLAAGSGANALPAAVHASLSELFPIFLKIGAAAVGVLAWWLR